MFFKRSYIFLLLLLFYFFKLCFKPIFSLGPSIKIAAASFLYWACEKGADAPWKGGRQGLRGRELLALCAFCISL